ncbi:hypothetical protein AMTRI_Chr02g257070 [Amborella trichopoda]|uniref:Uncharacterized protein n=1 Tax=Amborella trichopoda TaxID=13333 RepID=U5DAP5_AMBTC|nr:hypothetical protein AMTR_s00062p00100520 [Amborella trichopoda]
MEKLGNFRFRFPRNEAEEISKSEEVVGERKYVDYREERVMESSNKVVKVETEAVIDHRQLLRRYGGFLIEEWRSPKPPRGGEAVIYSTEHFNAHHFARKNQKPW